MITLRQHVASLVAVFLALAVGITLGGGLLGGSDGSADQQPDDAPTTGPAAPATDEMNTFADAFAFQGATRLYADGLNGHAAAILAMPGADPAQIKSLQAQILAAGGAITGTYSVAATLLDPAQKSAVDGVGGQLLTQLADPRIDPNAPTYERMGALLALAMATTQTSSVRADLAAVTIRETLASADLLVSPSDVRNAPLVLVVLPPGQSGPDVSPEVATLLSGLVSGVGTNATGVVVAGDTVSADAGELASLRESELVGPISTVDGIDTAIGQVTTVLAMIAVVSGVVGSFGAAGSDSAVPLG